MTPVQMVPVPRAAVLLGADGSAKIGDVGMARFMPQDYLTSTAAAGTLAWAVSIPTG